MTKRISPEAKHIAIDTYAKHGNMTIAAMAAGVTRWTLWKEGTRNLAFKRQLEDAKATYCDLWEALLDKRIVEGGKDSAILLMFKMKAEMPDKYREKFEHKIDHNIKIISGVPRPLVPEIKRKPGRPRKTPELAEAIS